MVVLYFLQLLKDGAVKVGLGIAADEVVVHDVVCDRHRCRHSLVLHEGDVEVAGAEPLPHLLYVFLDLVHLLLGDGEVYKEQQAQGALVELLFVDVLDVRQHGLQVGAPLLLVGKVGFLGIVMVFRMEISFKKTTIIFWDFFGKMVAKGYK